MRNGKRMAANGASYRSSYVVDSLCCVSRSSLLTGQHPHQTGVLLNTPNNPTGKVFTPAELETIAKLCRKWNALAVTDEVYEHIIYEGKHVSMATLDGMAERTVTTRTPGVADCISCRPRTREASACSS